MPIVDPEADDAVTYRTHRLNRNVQVWMVEGRDYRSPNAMSDGPDKSIWGAEQAEWLRSTILSSDAPVKILVHPTPLVGPDGSGKGDNHTNPGGFQYERDVFFAWLRENGLEDDLIVVTGDRHWQYHSIHPAGVQEFSVGALNDANSRYGVRPGEAGSTDPIGLIRQPYLQAPPSGGFLEIDVVEAGGAVEARLTFVDDEGRETYRHTEHRAMIPAARAGRFNLIPVWSRLADDAGAFDLEGGDLEVGPGVQAVAVSGDGYLVATVSNKGLEDVGPTLTLWTTPRGAAIWSVPFESGGGNLAFSADGRTLSATTWQGRVDLRVRDEDDSVRLSPEPFDSPENQDFPSSRVSLDRTLIATADPDGVHVYERSGGRLNRRLARLEDGATAPLTWTEDGRLPADRRPRRHPRLRPRKRLRLGRDRARGPPDRPRGRTRRTPGVRPRRRDGPPVGRLRRALHAVALSEYLTHIAVLDDAARLAQRMPSLPAPVRTALERHTEWARTGAMTRGNHLYTVPLLTAYRDRLEAGPLDDATLQRLAFVMGWIAHRAADLYVKATHRAIDPEEYYFTPEREGDMTSLPRLWNDLDVYREVYASGARGVARVGLFTRDLEGLPAAASLDVSAVEPVVHSRAGAEMAHLHMTVADERAPFAARVDAYLDAYQPLYVRLDRYADRVELRPEERQRFSTATRFYDASDPLLQLAEALRVGRAARLDLEAALIDAETSGSQYAQMLAMTMRWYADAGRVLEGDMTPEALVRSARYRGRVGRP